MIDHSDAGRGTVGEEELAKAESFLRQGHRLSITAGSRLVDEVRRLRGKLATTDQTLDALRDAYYWGMPAVAPERTEPK